MTSTTETLPVETGGTDITRFNALRHGVLSRYTVLPWESTDEYRAVVEALVVTMRVAKTGCAGYFAAPPPAFSKPAKRTIFGTTLMSTIRASGLKTGSISTVTPVCRVSCWLITGGWRFSRGTDCESNFGGVNPDGKENSVFSWFTARWPERATKALAVSSCAAPFATSACTAA